MAEIAPLKPLRFASSPLARVVAPPYDVVDAAVRAQLAAKDEHNIVHVDLPEGQGDLRYERARRLFEQWQGEGVLSRDKEPAFFRYAQRFTPPGGGPKLERCGFFAAVRAVPFKAHVVLPHERTLDAPKLDRLKLWRATRAALSPGMMLYFGADADLDRALDSAEPLVEFSTDDSVHHALSRVVDRRSIGVIRRAIADRLLLIADGHHRYSTALALGDELDAEARRAGAVPPPDPEYRFFPALLVDGAAPGLIVYPTHRVVSGLSTFDFGDLLRRASEVFRVEAAPARPEELVSRLSSAPDNAFALLAGSGAALLAPRADASSHPRLCHRPEVLKGVATVLLHDALLDPLLGSNKAVEYVQDFREAARSVARGEAELAALMKPMPVEVLRAVAEAGEVVPPKSTFFYPKVPTGLFFHTLRLDHAV